MPLIPFSRLFESILTETRLESGRVLLADGGLGSELMRQGVDRCDILKTNLIEPRRVLELHEAYLNAGSEILTANTFGIWEPSYDYDQTDAILRGIELAAEAATRSARSVSVWLSLPGFCAEAILGDKRFQMNFRNDVALLVETCVTVDESVNAVRSHAVSASTREAGFRPVIASFYIKPDGRLTDGTPIDAFADDSLIDQFSPEILGANCGDTPESFIDITLSLRQATRRPILIQPNAGIPLKDSNGKLKYPLNPDEYAELCLRIIRAGATIIGGCCGVTPEHISSLRRELATH